MLRRREFAGLAALPFLANAAPKPMKIVGIDTIYWPSRNDADFWPHWTWVRIRTDAGIEGIGETYPRNETEAAAIHAAGRALLGRDPRDVERIWADLYRTFDYSITGGAEMRAISALDLALWDLAGKALDAPVWSLLGGRSNPRVRLYNTCFPHKYDFNKEPDKIMQEVLDGYGISAIKVWPFDGAAHRNKYSFVTDADIEEALRPVRILRDKFGNKIEIAIECHSNWNLSSAIRIARALEPLRPMWLEDMLLPGSFGQYRQLAESTTLPLTVGERMAGRRSFQQLIESKTPKFVMFDVCWCGGITEARKITAMADTADLPFAPHTAGGPLLFYASTHLSTAMPNLWIQESCQRFYEHDWKFMLEDVWVPSGGSIAASDAPGFGLRIRPDVWRHSKAVTRSTTRG
ncbi:MAG: mandelate racemase/muconate lactonizing enzyme family protein [Bryobacteraceae bacterium]|nr:mandelate racemase/muconate lactonizing enzyme family protein [Bryobacteraceae bacterium]